MQKRLITAFACHFFCAFAGAFYFRHPAIQRMKKFFPYRAQNVPASFAKGIAAPQIPPHNSARSCAGKTKPEGGGQQSLGSR